MRRLVSVAALALAATISYAQTSSEAIIGSCPLMPSDHDIAVYIVKGENYNVQKYFQQLGEANRAANTAAQQEYSHRDFAKEQANMQKKQQQVMSQQASRQEAGQKMMKFIQTLTPEQQQKFMSFRKEADAMQYLASIGKLDELHDLMEGTPGAQGDQSVVSQADMALMKRDLTGEYAAVNEPMYELGAKLNDFDQEVDEKAEQAYQNSIDAHRDNSGGKAGGLWDTEAVDNDMIAFWSGQVAARKKILLDYMQSIRNIIPIDKISDKKKNAERRMTGQSPLMALESAEFMQAMNYLHTAENIFPGTVNRTEEISEMMSDKTQEINSNE